jgi:hypothetical protein
LFVVSLTKTSLFLSLDLRTEGQFVNSEIRRRRKVCPNLLILSGRTQWEYGKLQVA